MEKEEPQAQSEGVTNHSVKPKNKLYKLFSLFPAQSCWASAVNSEGFSTLKSLKDQHLAL